MDFHKEFQSTYDPEKLKTKFSHMVQEWDEETEEEKNRKKDQMLGNIEKKKAYENFVLEKYRPKISIRKKQEMEELVAAMKPDHKNKRSKSRKGEEKGSPTSNIAGLARPKSDMNNIINRSKIRPNPLAPKTMPKKEPIVFDYLTETRRKRDL